LPLRRAGRIPALSLGYDSKATSRMLRRLSAGGQFLYLMTPENPEGSLSGSSPVSHPGAPKPSTSRRENVRKVVALAE
jgi:hypothetical protein